MRTGGVTLAALAAIGIGGRVIAQEASPVPNAALGRYVVIRTRTVKPDMNYADLVSINRDQFVPIIAAIPGFVAYTVIYSDTTREWTAIGIYTDKAGADASTKAAADFIATSTVNDYWVDPNPVVVDGTIIVNAG
jgi:hypothetical protein